MKSAFSFSFLVLALACAVGWGGGCSRQAQRPAPAAPPGAEELARVGDESITVAQFQAALARRGVGSDPAARRALLEELIRFRATVQEAKRRGLDRDPEMVAAWESLLAGKVREAEREKVRPRLEVTPAEVEAEYAAHPERYALPARVRAAWIFVEAPAGFSAEKRAERRAGLAQAREKALALGPDVAGFGKLAAEMSFDQATKYRGGDLGYLTAGTETEGVEKPVAEAAFALEKPGEVSDIIETPGGYCLVRLEEREPGGTRPLASVRGAIARRLTRERVQAAERELADSVLVGRKVETHAERLAAVPAPTTNAAAQTADNPPSSPPTMPAD